MSKRPVLLAMLLAGCATDRPPPPASAPISLGTPPRVGSRGPVSDPAPSRDQPVRSTVLGGDLPPPTAPRVTDSRPPRPGNVNLNFPAVDVQAVAKAVLGDVLGLSYVIAPDLRTPVTVVTQRPIARADVLRFFEDSLRASNLALLPRGSIYTIVPLDQAKAQAAPANGDATGFATETVQLRFINADELKKLIDPVLPGLISQSDGGRGVLTLAGTAAQRTAARELVRQFDVDWLRNTAFALLIPQRTDARLIVPELDRLINADNAPTKGLVRLIAMDRLNGILAVSTQRQYLDDVRRFVEVLDREGQSNERRLFVYRVQNGRSGDLAQTLAGAFGGGQGQGRFGQQPGTGGRITTGNAQTRSPTSAGFQTGQLGQNNASPNSGGGFGGSGQQGSAGFGGGTSYGGGNSGPGSAVSGIGGGAGGLGGTPGNQNSGPVSATINTGDLNAAISSDETNNAVVVYATPRDYAVIEDALRKLDIPATQVFLEAAIVEVSFNNSLTYGFQGLFRDNDTAVGNTLSRSVTTLAGAGFNAIFTPRSVAAAINALESRGRTNVISAPKLLVLNNQTAAIQVGAQVPISTGSFTSAIGGGLSNSIDYRDTGIILKVTPRVNSSGVVLLDIAQEVSDLGPILKVNDLDNQSFTTRKIATSVAVQDGFTLALGGLIRNNLSNTNSGLPLISRIPVIGPLVFGNRNRADSRTELIVLLRPVVIRSTDDARQVTDELRDKLRSLAPLLRTLPANPR